VPGKKVRRWGQYHALRKKGMSKKRAAMIANKKRRVKRRRR
jgi:hypothetical protein